MKTVIYLDVLLLMNFVVGYLLLRAAGLVCGVCPPFGRNLLGGWAAALATLVLLLPPLPLLFQLLIRLFGALCAVWAAFPGQSRRSFFRLTGWYFALNMGLAGLLLLLMQGGWLPGTETNNLAFYLAVSPGLLCGACGGVYLAVRLAALLLPSSDAEYGEAHVTLSGETLTLRTLRDTGFSAREPVTASPVLLVSLPAVEKYLPPDLCSFLQVWFSGKTASPPPGLRLCLVPMNTANGPLLAPAFRLPVTLGGRSWPGLPVAFSPHPLGDCQALAGTALFDET